uniref:Uncharacterized protein n=1 Tax=Tanacetum cinerariifolium TaxID=118510 RepID=A0A6L2KHV9_TANCI|nr:hypothetical protein [Tanacetum cinerariifolium]
MRSCCLIIPSAEKRHCYPVFSQNLSGCGLSVDQETSVLVVLQRAFTRPFEYGGICYPVSQRRLAVVTCFLSQVSPVFKRSLLLKSLTMDRNGIPLSMVFYRFRNMRPTSGRAEYTSQIVDVQIQRVAAVNVTHTTDRNCVPLSMVFDRFRNMRPTSGWAEYTSQTGLLLFTSVTLRTETEFLFPRFALTVEARIQTVVAVDVPNTTDRNCVPISKVFDRFRNLQATNDQAEYTCSRPVAAIGSKDRGSVYTPIVHVSKALEAALAGLTSNNTRKNLQHTSDLLMRLFFLFVQTTYCIWVFLWPSTSNEKPPPYRQPAYISLFQRFQLQRHTAIVFAVLGPLGISNAGSGGNSVNLQRLVNFSDVDVLKSVTRVDQLKDLEYLRYGSKGSRPALSISKMQAAYYPDDGLEQMVSDQFWIDEDAVRTHMRILSVVRIEVFSMHGYDYMKKIVLLRADLNEHVIAERDFNYLYLSNFEDLYLLNLQGHLNHLPPKDKKILTTAVNQWTRQLVIRQRVEDFQLGIESYQTQLNLTKPQWDATGFEYKHDYTVIDSPKTAIFRDKYGV